DKLSVFMVDLLSGVGVTVQKKPGYLFLSPVREDLALDEPDQEIFFYRAKYRPVGFLMDLTSSLFKTGRFSFQRGIRGADSQVMQVLPAGGVSVGAAVSTTKKKSAPDTGTSALSQIDKNEQDSFVFQGNEKEIALLQKLLVQLDTPVGEVLVKGMVYEVTTGEKDGSAFGLALNIMQGKFGLNIGKLVANGDSITFKNASIDAVFSALSTDSRFKSISNPSLRVKSGASARFSVGSDVPVLGAVQFDKNGNPIQSVEYKPSGVIFDLKPQIRENVIDLVINQQLSSFIPTVTGVNNSPTLIKREISTSIGASNDDVIVLGGLDEDKSSGDSSGFSFFPSWLKSRGGESSKTQILLVLQVQKI
ncbi:MAG: type II secretory pathway, component PulD, partial [Anaerolineae bacterium]|nr:type II secretory pathway, component PulD [Anaerolineae bacterium]